MRTAHTTTAKAERQIAKIARDILDLETLETRKSDSLDFHDMAVWQLRDALIAAYNAGREAGKLNPKSK